MKPEQNEKQRTMNEFSEVMLYYGLCALRAAMNELCERFRNGMKAEAANNLQPENPNDG